MSHGKFRFQVIFTGICGYVEKDDSMTVVLPQAPVKHSSIDGQLLEKHDSALFFLDKDEVQKAIPLRDNVVTFDVKGATNNYFQVEHSFRQYIAPMAALSPETLMSAPYLTGTDSNFVAARVEIKQGRIGVTGPSEPWRFRPPLFGMPSFDNRILRNEVFVDFGFVSAASFRLLKLDGTPDPEEPKSIAIHDGSKSCVIIANLEGLDQDDRGIDVSRCSIGDALAPKRDDLSFRWHYEMLEEDARKRLIPLCDYDEFGAPILPHPKKRRKSAEAGSGPNCYGARFSG